MHANEGSAGSGERASGVLVAAGSGERLGADRPKALVELGGRPLFTYALASMLAAGSVDEVVIAAPPGHLEEIRVAAAHVVDSEALGAGSAGSHEQPVARVVEGGDSRSESVRNALEAAAGDLVVVHDAARPFARPELFDRVVRSLYGAPGATGAVIAAARVSDTIKEVADMPQAQGPAAGHETGVVAGEPVVSRTLDRSRLWAAQTPQAFRVEPLRDALAAVTDLGSATDDAMLIESGGLSVRLAASSSWNFKVTTAEDLAAAEHLLEARLL